jgi:hypothetical protein
MDESPTADAVRKERRGFPALSLCFRTFFPWSPCLMFVYLHLVLGPVPAALTSITSAVQINVRRALLSSRSQSVPMRSQYATTCLLKSSSSSFFFYLRVSRTNPGWYGRLEREDRIGNDAWEGSGFEGMPFSDGMGSMEVVLSELECQCHLRWPWE